ncbi:hypothetical protein [Halovenus salina]|uniref:Uncharacterized protein n=1 Tax=Halovenus salina TaxID=1510225 RepID=A0ABD5WAD6_9EURY|nr:hypothetical protein [Halovenus salina]
MGWNKIGELHRMRGNITVYRNEPWSECPNCGEYDYTEYKWSKDKAIGSDIVRAKGGLCHNCRYKEPMEGEKKFNKRVNSGIKLSQAYGELDNNRYKIK